LNFYGKEGYVQPTRLPTVVELRHQDPGYTPEAISARLQAYRRKEGGIPYGDIAARLEPLGCTVTTVQLAHYARGDSLPPPPAYLSLKAALDQLEGKPIPESPTIAQVPGGTIDELLRRLAGFEQGLVDLSARVTAHAVSAISIHDPQAIRAQEGLPPQELADQAARALYTLYFIADAGKQSSEFREAFKASIDPTDVGYLNSLLEALAVPDRETMAFIRRGMRPPVGLRRKK
jgi:hypothetical protein